MPSKSKIRKIVRLLGAVSLLTLSPAISQAQDIAPAWVKLCTKDNNNQNICTTLRNIFSETGQPLTTINIIDYDNQSDSRRLQIAVPTGRRVQEGIKIQIDKHPVKKMDYLFCVGLSCVAEGALDNSLLNSLKNGHKMTITSVNYEGVPNPIEVSLAGFDKAFSGPGMRASDIAEQRKRIIQDLDAREKDLATKLKAAQDKAKRN